MSSGSMVDISAKEQQIAGRIDNAITNGLAVSDRGGGVQFVNAGQVTEFAKMMAVANSGVRKHLRGNPGACLAICVQAVEWGMSPYAVANKSYFVNDQIAFESQLVQAVILKRAPIKGRIKFEFTGSGDTLRCRAWARLRDEEDEIVEYESPLFKDITVKNSPLWKSDPEQQFSYYAGRALCRRHFPDVLLGVYTPEEFVDGLPAPDTPIREVAPAPRSINAAFDAIAGGGKKPEDAHVINHDEETGEIQEGTEEADQASASQADQQDGTEGRLPQEDPGKNALLEKLRSKARRGTNALRLALRNLVPVENEMLTNEDHDALGYLAEEADREKETADASQSR